MNLERVPPQLCMSSAIKDLLFIYKTHAFPPAFWHSYWGNLSENPPRARAMNSPWAKCYHRSEITRAVTTPHYKHISEHKHLTTQTQFQHFLPPGCSQGWTSAVHLEELCMPCHQGTQALRAVLSAGNRPTTPHLPITHLRSNKHKFVHCLLAKCTQSQGTERAFLENPGKVVQFVAQSVNLPWELRRCCTSGAVCPKTTKHLTRWATFI